MLRQLGITALVFLALGCLELSAQVDSDNLNRTTVRITVKTGSSHSVGSGIVVCQRDGQAFILTARHVIYGSQTNRIASSAPIEIEFFQNRWPQINGTRRDFKARFASTKDLALIRVPTGNRRLDTIPVAGSASLKPLQEIYTTGHPVGSQRSWLPRKGTINEIGELILYTANVGEGYSGGPLVNSAGALIGINTRIEKSTGVHAIPVDEVLRTLRPWMDLSCLQKDAALDSATGAGQAETGAAFNSLPQAIDQYYQLRDSYALSPQTYRTWHAKTDRVARQQGSSRSIQNYLADIGRMLQSAGSENQMESILYEIDFLVEAIEDEMVPASLPDQLSAPSGSMERLAGVYSLTGYQDATGVQLSPPLINGSLNVQGAGGGSGTILMQVQVPQLFVYINQTVQGTYDGQMFSGIIMNSNLGNAGTPWAATIGFAGNTMTMHFINGEIWHWVKN